MHLAAFNDVLDASGVANVGGWISAEDYQVSHLPRRNRSIRISNAKNLSAVASSRGDCFERREPDFVHQQLHLGVQVWIVARGWALEHISSGHDGDFPNVGPECEEVSPLSHLLWIAKDVARLAIAESRCNHECWIEI